MSDNVKIDVLDDGPLIVDNLETLTNSKGENVEIEEKTALCRCGHSGNKPFCDGSHKNVGFSGNRVSNASFSKERAYEGKDITIHDNRTICWHAAECVSGLNSVFDKNTSPWINPENAEVNQVIEVVRRCPSGALSYTIDNIRTTDFNGLTEINIIKNGPYNVSGNIEINVADEIHPPSKDHYSLCRCGASKNKPYCDGSHNDIKFTDEDN